MADTLLNLPEEWDKWRVSDAHMAEDYENVSPQCRCALKSGLALAHFHFYKNSPYHTEIVSNPHLGFTFSRSREPAGWAGIIFPENFAAVARLCAAAILPVLAHVQNIFAVCVGGKPSRGILAGLELCGLENIYNVPNKDMNVFLQAVEKHCADNLSFCRLLFLNCEKLPQLAGIKENTCLKIRTIDCHPNIRVEESAGISLPVLEFAQDWRPGDYDPAKPVDAIFCQKSASVMDPPNFSAPLTCGPGCEGFWLYKDLNTDFFTCEKVFCQML